VTELLSAIALADDPATVMALATLTR